MGEFLSQLPSQIQVHIKSITKSSGLSDSEESFEKIAKGWLDKLSSFEKQTQEQNMVETENLEMDNPQGAVALTYSGSLVLIGPLDNNVRKAGYYSIGIRKDVPEAVNVEDSTLSKDVSVNETIEFGKGPVKSTSAIYKIAVCKNDLTVVEQEEKISEATVIITEEFIEINKAMVPVG